MFLSWVFKAAVFILPFYFVYFVKIKKKSKFVSLGARFTLWTTNAVIGGEFVRVYTTGELFLFFSNPS